ncbi:MAG: ROK family transcriptional regulator, partial [Firmicutes bacterium]|nr:ROK family transcriptional regulator [Bacillota bacterium]
MKVLNRLLVRDMIRRLGPIARYEIAKETGLTPSTVTVIVAELLEAGVIKEVGHGASSGGRRPILLELNPTAAYVFAIRIQRGELMTAIFDLGKNIMAQRYSHLDTDLPDNVVEMIGSSFEELIEETKINPDAILWCGVACPGLVSSHRCVVERSSNLDWIKVPLSALISKRLGGLPVHVENISNAAALAEKEYGLGRGHKHLVFINLSVGIGAGILADGEIYGGVKGFAGEIG